MDVNARAADNASRTKFMMISPGAALFRGRLRGSLSRYLSHRTRSPNSVVSRGVLDIGFRPVVAGRGFGLPLAVGGFVLDHFAASGYPLLRRHAPRRCQRRGM